MRVISLVPSWTETLLEAGVDVVGRTRFCVHPTDRVKAIPVVGGTKDLSAEKVAALGADLVILDREENPKEFLSLLRLPYLDTHVDSVTAMAEELVRLAERLNNKNLSALAARARRVASLPPRPAPSIIPGLRHELTPFAPGTPVRYVIWRNPWMAAGRGTYIDSVLRQLGFVCGELPEGKYPEIADGDLAEGYTLYSSEPFPFLEKREILRREGRTGAIVDGESYSWFGVRGLLFLEECFAAELKG